ncbi:MAG: hypothetical protein WBB01_05500 [Phormidesmis sp.]
MSDALERLKQKNRPKVTPRNTQVGQTSEDIQTSRHTDNDKLLGSKTADLSGIEGSKSEDIQMSRHTKSQMLSRVSSTSSSADAEALEVKRSTFRLEVGLIGRLHRLCQDNGISREVMIESMFEYAEQNPEALHRVMEVAKAKNDYRQQIANRKRAKSMIEKFG